MRIWKILGIIIVPTAVMAAKIDPQKAAKNPTYESPLLIFV